MAHGPGKKAAGARREAKAARNAAGPDPAAPEPSPKPASAARTAAAAVPGPVITRAPREGLNGGGERAAPKGPARAAPPPATAASPPAAKGGRTSPARLRQAHELAARRLHAPELALSADEATEIAEAWQTLGDLIGWTPSGPLVAAFTVAWTVATIYGSRLVSIADRRRREAAERAASAPPAPAAGARPAAPAPAGKPAPAAMPPTIASVAGGNGLGDPFVGMPEIGAAEGMTPFVPGVPRTTLEERTDPL